MLVRAHAHKITSVSALIVMIEVADEPIYLSALARKAGVSTACITGLMDNLESLGLICRVRDVADRRKITAGITTKGERVMREILGKPQAYSSDSARARELMALGGREG